MARIGTTLGIFIILTVLAPVTAQDKASVEPLMLAVEGRVADGDDHKLSGCKVLVFRSNDLVAEQVTERNGRFGMVLALGAEYSMEFRMEGFLPKRVLIDTRADLPKDLIGLPPVEMQMSMLPMEKYSGADTDELDFPFAIVRYDKRMGAFAQDQQYTADMMRTNGALLLMSGRAGKK